MYVESMRRVDVIDGGIACLDVSLFVVDDGTNVLAVTNTNQLWLRTYGTLTTSISWHDRRTNKTLQASGSSCPFRCRLQIETVKLQ